MNQLLHIPISEIQRVINTDITPEKRTALFATLCRINTLYMIARAGSGHIGSSFSSLDIVSWLFLNELKPREEKTQTENIYFSSKGHDAPGLYAVLIGLGLLPYEKIHQMRRLNGLPGHPDVESVPIVQTNTGSLGMGISKAKGMAIANRMKGVPCAIYVLTGDGELQEGQLWESLFSAVNMKLSEITVIVDHNKLQSDTWVKNVSDLGDLEKKFGSYGWHVARCDGHDLQAVGKILEDFKSIPEKPKILIADTIKGKGVSFMEHTAMESDATLYRFHSGAPDQDTYSKAVTELVTVANDQLRSLGLDELLLTPAPRPERPSMEGFQRLVPAYSKALVEQAEKNPMIVALDGDLVLDTGLIPFRDKFPNRFIECGIAEQDMVSQAGGMALKGLLPIAHSFACFLSSRPNEQIYNNATERTKIIYVGSLAGLLPAGPGHSHQCVRDISALGAIPGLNLIEPCNEAEVSMALDFCINSSEQSSYLRLVSIPCNIPYALPAGYKMEFGKGVVLVEGKDALIIGYGPILLSQAYHTAMALKKRGLSLKVVNLPWLNQVDENWLHEIVNAHSTVFTLDNHYIKGGQGEMIAAKLSELGLNKKVRHLGVLDVPRCGQNDEVLRAHGLDSESIETAVEVFMEVPCSK